MGQPDIGARDEAVKIFFSLLRLGRMHGVPTLRAACVVSGYASLSVLWSGAYARDFAAAVLHDARNSGAAEDGWFVRSGVAFIKAIEAIDDPRHAEDAMRAMRELRAALAGVPAPQDNCGNRVVRVRADSRSLLVPAAAPAPATGWCLGVAEALASVTGETKTLLRLTIEPGIGAPMEVTVLKRDGVGRDTEWSIHPQDVRYAATGVL